MLFGRAGSTRGERGSGCGAPDIVDAGVVVPELFAVFGRDYAVSGEVGLSANATTLRQRSQALARALDMKLTTVPCD
jgi:hypothetical protein